ncbi:TBC1 domain family member 10B [Brachionichthys hirsutus]|uniref:TBC1 domain family member 10B n=1 Tax=Brachionichthys hirsutus TaxID=412623 RepID=UPI00360519D4
MLNSSSSAQKSLGEEDGSDSNAGSEVGLEPETDRFGFILTNGHTTGSVGPSPELVRRREAKWINIIVQWDHILMEKPSKVKVQCQKGIPASLRAKCWPLLCGAADRMKLSKKLYQNLDSQPALQSWVDVIERDLDRQFPFHEMFLSKDGHGQRGLFRVLKAYTQYQPEEGYCQAQGPVAAVLLMNMPAEQAFWCLVQISEHYLPGYYSPLLEGVLFDAAMLTWVLRKTCPAAYKHLQRHEVEPLMFATDWLMCLFTRHLPFNTLLRVWDLFFCYGVRVLFQAAAVLVSRVLGRAEQRKRCQGQMETLEKLRGVRDQVQDEGDAFIAEVCSVPLSARELEKQMEKELEKWRRSSPSSTFDPRDRCQGFQVAWGRARQNQEEQDRKERQKGNLSIPLLRSASTLSLSAHVIHTSLRKGGTGYANERPMGARHARSSSTESNFKKVTTSGTRQGTESEGKLDTPAGKEPTAKTETRPQNATLAGDTVSRRGAPGGGQHRHRSSTETAQEGESHTKSVTGSQDETEQPVPEETSMLRSPARIQPKDGAELAAEIRAEAEKPASDDVAKDSKEETAQCSEAAATEPTRGIEDRFLTANTPTPTPQNEETSTSVAPPQSDEANFNASEEQTPEQPEIQPPGEVKESTEPPRENAIREISTEARHSKTERRPRVQDEESRLVKDETGQSSHSLTRTSALHCGRPSRDICIRKSSSNCGPRNGRRLSEDHFVMPQKAGQSRSIPNQPLSEHARPQPDTRAVSPPKAESGLTLTRSEGESKGTESQGSDPLKRLGLFRRGRGDQPKKTKTTTVKMQVPKILIQDFSDERVRETPLIDEVEEKLSSRERRRQRRERERKEKEEERLRKKSEKEREQERKRLLAKGKSSEMQKGKGSGDEAHRTKTGSQTRRYSASYADSYF